MLSDFDKEQIQELIENSKLAFPDLDPYLVWLCAHDFYILEVLKLDIPKNEEIENLRLKSEKEFFNMYYENVSFE